MVVVIKHKVEMWPTNNPREALGLYELNNCLCLVLAWHWHSLWPSKIPLLSFVLPQCKWCWGWPQTRLGGKRIQVTSLLLLSRFSRVWLCATPQMAAHQAPPSPGFFRQEHWSGLPFPSPMHESEKWKWSCSVSVRFFMTPWTTAHQAPPSMGFSRQEYWSGVPLLSPQCPEIFNVIHNKIHNKMEIKQTNSYGSLRPVRNQNISFVFSSCCKVGNQWLSSFFSFLKKLRNQRKYGEWSHSSRV